MKLKISDEKSQSLQKWTETYLPLLKSNKELPSKFKDDLRKGIPFEVRGEAWSLIIGNDLRINPKMYEALLVRVRLAERALDDEQFKQNIKVVGNDLHRTFPELNTFRQGGILHQPLKNLLAAYSIHRPDIGYV